MRMMCNLIVANVSLMNKSLNLFRGKPFCASRHKFVGKYLLYLSVNYTPKKCLLA
jgi:hypothetical protein